MQSGKILPGFKSFLANAVSSRPTDKDARSKQEQQDDRPKRQPSREEVLEALEQLTQQESFQKNNLRAEAITLEGLLVIAVKDASGNTLRTLRVEEILRILTESGGKISRAYLGRILDRRI
jgi:hypothetical protein